MDETRNLFRKMPFEGGRLGHELLFNSVYFSKATSAAAAYVLFVDFAFLGPSHRTSNQAEFGFFVDRFTFLAGLFFAEWPKLKFFLARKFLN